MIYDEAEPTSPIGQGDIFTKVPLIELPTAELAVIDEKDSVHTMTWEAFASLSQPVSAVIGVRPTLAIVGTQECDALRAPNITLFEIRAFREVERLSKDTTKPSKWASIITQHARVNQKWFYLPADELMGFSEKMGVDFLSPIRVPREVLERLVSFRKGRLNEIAKHHFRERIAEFFRRYAYDEWYSLTEAELAEYRKTHPDAEAFSWQETRRSPIETLKPRQSHVPPLEEPHSPTVTRTEGTAPNAEYESSRNKGLLDFLAEGEKAANDLTDIFAVLNTETVLISNKMDLNTTKMQHLASNPSSARPNDYRKLTLLAASDMNTYSKRIEELSPRLQRTIEALDKSYSGVVLSADVSNEIQFKGVGDLRSSISELLRAVHPNRASIVKFRDSALGLKAMNLSKELNRAAERESEALNGVLTSTEELESFGLRIQFLIDEKLGEASS